MDEEPGEKENRKRRTRTGKRQRKKRMKTTINIGKKVSRRNVKKIYIIRLAFYPICFGIFPRLHSEPDCGIIRFSFKCVSGNKSALLRNILIENRRREISDRRENLSVAGGGSGNRSHIQRSPMKNHTTFRIGGNAEVFAAPDSADGVERVLQICREENIPCTVIGNGSNLLVGDRGVCGVVLQIYRNYASIRIEGTDLYVQAGALLGQTAAAAAREG